MQPAIISSYDPGRHNANLDNAISRLEQSAAYKDLSLVIVIPSHKNISTRVVMSWLNLNKPPNGKHAHISIINCEVGQAYEKGIGAVVEHPDMGKWKYLLTMEHDNIPPPHGILQLLSRMESEEGQQFAAIGGLYFIKGENGLPQIWGNPFEGKTNFRPQKPDANGGLVECCGTGMGFTMFRMSMFRDGKISRPWFKTNGRTTQDLYFWQKARDEAGYRCAIDCSVRVGHFDEAADIVW